MALRLLVALLAIAAVQEVQAFSHDEHCGTDHVWTWKQLHEGQSRADRPLATCRMEGSCDDPAVRDKTPMTALNVSLGVIVIGEAGGISDQTIHEQVETLNADWNRASIFYYVREIQRYTVDGSEQCLPAYADDMKWYYQIQEWKSDYGKNSDKQLNIFVTCQEQGSQGTLLGFGTFPWDREALSATGGIWMNSAYVGKQHKTLSHEIGHNLGLRHTFAGTNEVASCNDPCLEPVHELLDPAADRQGDWCSDTRATPMNYVCEDPKGNEPCGAKAPWGSTPIHNYMSYTPDNCMNEFTDQQLQRSHCWICSKIRGQVISGC